MPIASALLRPLIPVHCLSLFPITLPSTNPKKRVRLRTISVKQRPVPPYKTIPVKVKKSLTNPAPPQPTLSLEKDLKELSENQALGFVAAAQANFMRVIVQSDKEENIAGVELLCVVRAVLKKMQMTVLVGDNVLVGSIDWVNKTGMIEDVFQRKTETADPPLANVDHMLVMFSIDKPKIDLIFLIRFLVEAESIGIPFTLALNKSELADDESIARWKIRLRKWGYNPVFCSIESRKGLDTLQFILRGQTTVIVGPSGVGKSSLINALRGHQPVPAGAAAEGDNRFDSILGSKWFEDQRVGEVSARSSGRGKHTTRNVSLLPLSGGGFLADTPGFDKPCLLKVTKQSLWQHFPEIRKMLKDKEPKICLSVNCLHVGERGCVLNGDWERYPFYLQLLDEFKLREKYQLETVETKKDARYKVGDTGVTKAEPKSQRHKHKRRSHKKTSHSLVDELDEDDEDDDFEDDPIIRAIRYEYQ